MKIESFLLLLITCIFGIGLSYVSSANSKGKVCSNSGIGDDQNDDFVVVETESEFYPKIIIKKDIKLELDRIRGHFIQNKMTEASSIDLMVLVYERLFRKRDNINVPAMAVLMNETFQFILDMPGSAFEVIEKFLLCELPMPSNLRLELISAANRIDRGIYKGINFKHQTVISQYFPEGHVELKTVGGVKKVFELLSRMPAESPYHFLKDLPCNLNLREYLRFFMCVYAMSLQCKYILTAEKFTGHYLDLLLFNSTSVYLRAFPNNERGSNDLSRRLIEVKKFSRQMITKVHTPTFAIYPVRNDFTYVEKGRYWELPIKYIKVTILFGFYDSFVLLTSLGTFTREDVIVCMNDALLYALDHFQYGIFVRFMEVLDWTRFEVDRRRIISQVVSKPGISRFISDGHANIFIKDNWERLFEDAIRSKNMVTLNTLLRISLSDNARLSNLDHLFKPYFMHARELEIPESEVIEFYLIIPGNLAFTPTELQSLRRNYPALVEIAQLSHLKAELDRLIFISQQGNYEAIHNLITNIDNIKNGQITPYHFRMMIKNLPTHELILRLISDPRFLAPKYVEEAAYAAMETLNGDLLEFLIQNLAFEVTESFSKRWMAHYNTIFGVKER